MAKTIRKRPARNKEFDVKGSIWIEYRGRRFFGPGPAALLELIQDTGSIRQAARQMKMSYKKAWEIINMLNAGNRRPFVITQTGGASGGGSLITDEAKAMIRWYRQLRKRLDSFLEKEAMQSNTRQGG